MKNRIIRRSDIPRTTTFSKLRFSDLTPMSWEGAPRRQVSMPRGRYILLEALYDGSYDFWREVLIRAVEQYFKLTSDSSCMTSKPYTWDHAWHIRSSKLAHALGSALKLIRGARIRVRLASPIRGKLKS